MKTVCSVCGKVVKDDGRVDGLISHGVCEECFPEYREEMRKEIEEYKRRAKDGD